MPRKEIARRWGELGRRGMCEIGDRAIETDDGCPVVGEEEACEGP